MRHFPRAQKILCDVISCADCKGRDGGCSKSSSSVGEICDPPCDFGDKGERTGTRAMTRHAKSVIMTRICAYLRSKTKSVTVGFACLDGVSNVTLNVPLFGTRAKLLACEKTRKQTRDESHN